MIRQAEVVVGAEIDDVSVARAYDTPLGARQHALALVQALRFQACDISA
jgi:hypothetical protein